MDITKKSTASLIDELITCSIKCFMAQEQVMRGITDAEIAEAAKLAQKTNARRNLLIRAIDERLGELNLTPLEKTYQ